MNSSQKFFFEIPKYGWEGTWDCWLMFLAAYSRIFWRYIDWLCEHFFLKCWNSDFLKNSSLIGKVKFQKFFMTLLPKKSIFKTFAILIDWSFGSIKVLLSSCFYQKLGHCSKSRLFLVDPQQVVLMLTRLRAVWHVLNLVFSNFEFLVNLKIFWGGEVKMEFMPCRTTCPRNPCMEWNHPRLPCRRAHQGA